MGVLSDWQIKRDVSISPMEDAIKREGKISYGCGSYGYDMRVGYVFDVFSPINATEIDPKNFNKDALVRVDLTPKLCERTNIICEEQIPVNRCNNCQYNMRLHNYILISPHSFALAESIETFNIPRDVLCIVIGKSTYARCGLIVNCTPLEPEWRGKVTIELSNTTHLPLRVYCNEGIAQCIFIRGEEVCKVSYADKKGKYQDQTGLTLPCADK